MKGYRTRQPRSSWLAAPLALVLALVLGCARSTPTASPTAQAAAAPAGASPAAGSAGATPAAPPAFDFKGKTIHLVVGYTAGGGFDANARVLAPHLASALPGNPTIVVENQPGADSLVAAKTVLSSPQRGDDISVVVYVSTLLAKSVLKGGIDGFVIDQESVFIGMPDSSPQSIALCARKDVVASLDEFLNRTQPIKVGGLTGGSYYDALLRWMKEAGYPVDLVFGYAATAPMILAFNQGEVDAMPACRDQDLQQNPDWLEADKITPLFSFGLIPETLKKAQAQGKYPWLKYVLDDKPVSAELRLALESINDVNAGTNVYAISKTVSPAIRDGLRQGFKQAVNSSGFTADMQKRQLTGGYRSPDEISAILQKVSAYPAGTKDIIARLLGG